MSVSHLDLRDVKVASFGSPLEAELARAFVESHGIRCRLVDELLVGAALALAPGLGGVKLHVAQADAPRTVELLAEYCLAQRSDGQRAETADQRAARALRAALIGFAVLPFAMHLFSMWLLTETDYRALSWKGRLQYWGASALDFAVVALTVWLVKVAL